MIDHAVEILLVEDNPCDELLTLYTFKEHRVCNNIHVVRDGAEALDYLFGTGIYAERCNTDRPKVVLLDLKLPKVDGLEVLRQIRADPRTRTLPVVALTSSRMDQDIIDSYKLGVNSYIVKPVNSEQFSNVVKQLGFYWLLLNESVACEAPVCCSSSASSPTV